MVLLTIEATKSRRSLSGISWTRHATNHLNSPTGQKVGSTMTNIGNPDLRMAFHFIKKNVIAEDNAMPAPSWDGFDEFDTFDSILHSEPVRLGYTSDGSSKMSQIIRFYLGNDCVASVRLGGLRTIYGTSWAIRGITYVPQWNPATGLGPDTFRFDVDAEAEIYTNRSLIAV